MKILIAIIAAAELVAVAYIAAANEPPRTLLEMSESEFNRASP